jgi:hypothetical protein
MIYIVEGIKGVAIFACLTILYSAICVWAGG